MPTIDTKDMAAKRKARIRLYGTVAGMLLVFAIGVGLIKGCHDKNQALEPVWATGDAAMEWPKDRLPLKTWLDPELSSSNAYRKSFLDGVNAANRDIGCTVLAVATDETTADIRILSAGTDKPSELAGSWAVRAPRLEGLVHVAQPGSSGEFYLIVYHELGHVLGLAHDGHVAVPDYENGGQGAIALSIMTNNVVEHDPRLENGEFLPKLSEKDAAALKSRYCTK